MKLNFLATLCKACLVCVHVYMCVCVSLCVCEWPDPIRILSMFDDETGAKIKREKSSLTSKVARTKWAKLRRRRGGGWVGVGVGVLALAGCVRVCVTYMCVCLVCVCVFVFVCVEYAKYWTETAAAEEEAWTGPVLASTV